MQVLQGQVEFKKNQLAAIQKQYNEQLDRVANLSGFSSDLLTKKQELSSLSDATHEMSREISRLQVELLAENRIQRVQPATIPNEGSYFLKMIEVVGGGLMTLFGTMLAVTLWDYKARRLNSTNEIHDFATNPRHRYHSIASCRLRTRRVGRGHC